MGPDGFPLVINREGIYPMQKTGPGDPGNAPILLLSVDFFAPGGWRRSEFSDSGSWFMRPPMDRDEGRAEF